MIQPPARQTEVSAVALAFAAVTILTFAGLWQSASNWSLSYELLGSNR